VNCAGRTRSIIGAQSLINAGFPNRVVALKDGTMGWHLAGFALEHGESRRAPAPSPAGRAKAQAAAARVAKRFGVREINRDALARFAAEQGTRTLYLFDVRSPEEYEAGHMPGARSAPGGQLVQATDTYAATRNARVVLIDDDGVRSRMTASWLIQMGWDEIYVLRDAMSSVVPERGGEHIGVLGLKAAIADMITPSSLRQLLDDGRAVVIDLDTSLRYRAGHIPGAWFAVRSRLGTSLDKIPRAGTLVLASRDGVLARLAAPEAAAMANISVKVLAGGTAAWQAAGLPLETGETRLADTPNDVWRRPYDQANGVESAMRAYLSWELDLVRQIERDGDARFRRFPSV
ncbi:MAG: thiosulfate sulfurtransferase, partial [Proteobacteria bacterium]|nr:thiosulfate sulfurtransferase [Pseudomonadota bacterium]